MNESTASGALRRFVGRRAIVTGASRGIGAGVAERLAAEGASVALVARTGEPGTKIAGSLRETADRLADHGVLVAVVVADLTDEQDRARVVPAAVEALEGPIDVLVNNAAAAVYAPVVEMPLRRRRLLFEANVHAPLDLVQAVVPAMAAAGQGWIVNLGSRTARHWSGPPFDLGVTGTTTSVYGASKAALDRISNGLAAELFDVGIRVNAIAPRGAVMSEGAEALVGGRIDPEKIESLEHMVEAVVALCCCGPEVTGQSRVSDDVLTDFALDVRGLDAAPLNRDAST
ncbi:MAG: SDR family oxidoreductase [Microthrixaceae bacterium]